jgi:hypothetical protein
MEDIKSKVVGHFDMTCKEIESLYSYWEFKENGKAVQDNTEMGTWEVVDDVVVIKYDNKKYGHTALTFDDDNTLFGENVWPSGSTFSWILRRVVV